MAEPKKPTLNRQPASAQGNVRKPSQPAQAQRRPAEQQQAQRRQGQPSPNGRKASPNQAAEAKRRQQAAADGKAAQGAARAADNLGGIHGIEALAALVVSETKYARSKGRVILLLVVLLLASLGWNSVQSAFKPEPKLLALTQDGRVLPLPLLDEPLESRQVLMDWVRRNLPQLFDFNYVNYRSEIQKALDFAQPVTLEKFREDIDSANILSKVIDEFLILRANIVDEPAIVNETLVNGRRVWVVEVPMNLIYDSGEVRQGERRRITQQILFTAWIARASVMEYDGGLMLAKYSIKTRRD
jgi:intracellular multiplication protein IcmL